MINATFQKVLPGIYLLLTADSLRCSKRTRNSTASLNVLSGERTWVNCKSAILLDSWFSSPPSIVRVVALPVAVVARNMSANDTECVCWTATGMNSPNPKIGVHSQRKSWVRWQDTAIRDEFGGRLVLVASCKEVSIHLVARGPGGLLHNDGCVWFASIQPKCHNSPVVPWMDTRN